MRLFTMTVRNNAARRLGRWTMAMFAMTVALASLSALGGVPAANTAERETFDRDRQAILAMAGEYTVQFSFRETMPLAAGYAITKPYESRATEFAKVVDESSDRIVLQHVLVLHQADDEDGEGPTTQPATQPAARVVKHWRQEWRYEPTWTWQYIGHTAWRHRELSSDERAGKWVQEVYQVDDSPRYASLGRWSHPPVVVAGSVGSSWEGEPTWRPLPRREWLKRSDYHVLVGRNRHTISPTGWVHEQDNAKAVLDEAGQPVTVLAREWGYNTYDRRGEGIASSMSIDFTPGYEYWKRSAPFWQDVREAWRRQLAEPGDVRLAKRVDDKPLFRHMFEFAGTIASAEGYDPSAGRAFIDRTLARFRQAAN